MSINSYIFLCLLCIFSHACIARPLGAQISNKKNEEDNLVKISVIPNAQPSLPKNLEVAEKHIRVKENKDEEENNKMFDSKAGAKELNRQRLKITGANLQAKPLVSVGWRVPKRKEVSSNRVLTWTIHHQRHTPPVHN